MIGMSFWMVLYAAALIGSILLIKSLQPTGPLLYVLAVAPALPIGGTIIVFLRYIDAVDEYVRAITTRRFVIATGLTLFLCTAWGFLENNAGAHEFSLYLVYPLFWGLYGATSIFVRQAS
ncbi:membrane protein [Asticcacaulis sp. AC460]|nr:membrane protein [Asticcacaulis sp. AC460]